MEGFTSPNLAGGDLAVGDLANPSNLDSQLSRMRQIESGWGLPPLPDSVKLDLLAHPGLPDADQTGGFLHGLNNDMRMATTPAADPLSMSAPIDATDQQVASTLGAPQPPAPQGVLFAPESSLTSQLRKAWHGITGDRAPEIVTTTAVQDMKQRAVADGLLPVDTAIDGSWSPELNGVRSNLMKKDFADRISGNRPGAISTHHITDLLREWTSPSGLLSAAVAMDFLPDVKQIGQEFSDWGGKFRKFFDDPTSVHNLVDLVGPLDDIALPIINDALLFTGASEVVAFSRGAQLASEGLRGAELATELARGGQALGRTMELGNAGRFSLNAVDVAGEVDRFQHAGILSQRLQQSANLSQVGDAMAAWRQHTGVMMVKKTVQQGMKLGVAAQVEDAILPAAGDQKDRVQRFRLALNRNPMTVGLTSALELPFTPPSIFKPGAVTGPIMSAGASLRKAFTEVSQDEKLTATVFSSGMEWLRNSDPEKYQRVLQASGNAGPRGALVAWLGNGDEEKAGKVVSWMVTSAAVDKEARSIADGILSLEPGSKSWMTVFHLSRNKLINQLREAPWVGDDLENAEDFATQISRIFHGSGQPSSAVEKAKFTEWMDRFTGDMSGQAIRDARDLAENHNQLIRQGTLASMMDKLAPEDLATYLFKSWDRVNPEQWDQYNDALHLLDEVTVGVPLETLNPRDAVGFDWRPEPLRDHILAGTIPPEQMKGKLWDSFGGDIDPTQKRYGLMRTSEISRQQAFALRQHVQGLLDSRAALGAHDEGVIETIGRPLLAKIVGVGDSAVATDTELRAGADLLKSASANQVKAMVKDAAGELGFSKKQATDVAFAMRWVTRNGGNPEAALQFLDDQVRAINASEIWSGRLGVPGHLGLDQKLAELTRKSNFLAAEVALPAEQAQRLAASGYKAVYGTDFLMPRDIADMNGPFAAVTESTMRRMTLGTFVERHSNETINGLRERAFRGHLMPALQGTAGDAAFPPVLDPHGADANEILRILTDRRKTLGDEAMVAEATSMKSDRLHKIAQRVTNTSVPFSIYDMPNGEVHSLFDAMYGARGSEAIYRAMKQAKSIGWEYQGLTGIESRLVSNSWLRGALKAFGASDASTELNAVRGFERSGAGVLSGVKALAPRAVLGAVAGAAAADTQDDMGMKILAGAGVGLGTAALAGPASTKILSALDSRGWSEYSKLGDGVMRLRDRLRFSLNPFFDLQRYTEGLVLAGTSTGLPEGVTVPLNPSLGGLRVPGVKWGGFNPQEQDEALSGFRKAAAHWIDTDQVETTQRFFTEKGIMGFSPTRWMAGTWQHLTNQGMDPIEAADYVKGLYTYGTKGRSGLELSANFVFFPFSFQKKYMGQIAKFMADDLGRAVVLHDGLKMYDMLSEKYALHEYFDEHMPILRQLRKFNTLAYGINPGELGGINAPIIKGIAASGIPEMTIDPILNLFLPQAVEIHSEADASKMQKMAIRMMPVFRDLDSLWSDTQSQGHVMFSPAHLTAQAEVNRAYDEWNGFKKETSDWLEPQGITFDKVMRNPKYAALKEFIEAKRSEISNKYPGWAQARADSTGHIIQLQSEIKEIVSSPDNPAERDMAEFDNMIEQFDDAVSKKAGHSFKSDPEALPPSVYDGLRNYAVELAQRNNGFDVLYRRYYMKLLGPIHKELH